MNRVCPGTKRFATETINKSLNNQITTHITNIISKSLPIGFTLTPKHILTLLRNMLAEKTKSYDSTVDIAVKCISITGIYSGPECVTVELNEKGELVYVIYETMFLDFIYSVDNKYSIESDTSCNDLVPLVGIRSNNLNLQKNTIQPAMMSVIARVYAVADHAARDYYRIKLDGIKSHTKSESMDFKIKSLMDMVSFDGPDEDVDSLLTVNNRKRLRI